MEKVSLVACTYKRLLLTSINGGIVAQGRFLTGVIYATV